MILRNAVFIILIIVIGVNLPFAPVRAEDANTAMPSVETQAVEVELPSLDQLDNYTPPPMFTGGSDNTDSDAPPEEVKVFKIKETKKEEVKKTKTPEFARTPKKLKTSPVAVQKKQARKKQTPKKQVHKKNVQKKKTRTARVPLPPQRPSIIKVSPSYIEHLRAGKPRTTPPSPSEEYPKFESPLVHTPNLPEGRLKNTDIHDVLKQIDPDAAKTVRKQVKVLPSKNTEFHRVSAAPLPEKTLDGSVHISFAKNDFQIHTPLPEDTLENLLILCKTKPSKRLELKAFPSNSDKTSIKAARALSYKRAKAVKAYLTQHNIPEEIIDIRTSAGYQGVYDRVEITIQEIM